MRKGDYFDKKSLLLLHALSCAVRALCLYILFATSARSMAGQAFTAWWIRSKRADEGFSFAPNRLHDTVGITLPNIYVWVRRKLIFMCMLSWRNANVTALFCIPKCWCAHVFNEYYSKIEIDFQFGQVCGIWRTKRPQANVKCNKP